MLPLHLPFTCLAPTGFQNGIHRVPHATALPFPFSPPFPLPCVCLVLHVVLCCTCRPFPLQPTDQHTTTDRRNIRTPLPPPSLPLLYSCMAVKVSNGQATC
eukprot:GGOE01055352.1.p4 GENE.GGOE01055352.1~~GGOE01055352.1.p4  ORF type:complete len:101 (-),score=7.70 GGOE01055352.1:31-333(-)